MLKVAMPNRRRSETIKLSVGEPGRELSFYVTIGYAVVSSDQGQRLVINEVFLKHGKEGQAMDALCSDAGILISNLLQSGFPVTELCDNMSILPVFDGQNKEEIRPASIIGATLELIAEEQAKLDQI